MITHIVGNDGPKPTIKFKEQKLEVSHLCPDILTYIEQGIVNSAIIALDRPGLTAKAQAKREKATFAAIDSGDFGPGGDRWQAVMSSGFGAVMMLWACIYDNHNEITVDDVTEIMRDNPNDVKAALKMVIPSFFLILAKKMGADQAKAKHLIETELPLAMAKLDKVYGNDLKSSLPDT